MTLTILLLSMASLFALKILVLVKMGKESRVAKAIVDFTWPSTPPVSFQKFLSSVSVYNNCMEGCSERMQLKIILSGALFR